MGISLAPDQTTTAPVDPLKPKPLGLAPSANLTATGAPATAPLPTEYPSAPSTTGTPQNRLQLATTAFDTFAKSTAPQYTADLREATQKAAGAGALGSGQLRTTYGNLANQRALALDTERSNLINSATAATIGDQQAARGLDISQQGADTSRIAALGGLDVAKGTLGLETQKAATAASQGQQSLDLQKQTAAQSQALQAAGLTGILNGTETLAAKQLAIQSAIDQGHLTNEQGQLALAQLAQATSAGQNQQQIDIQKKTADINAQVAAGTLSIEQGKLALSQLANTQQFGLATAAQDIQSKVALGQLSIAQASQALDEKVKTGELSVDQAKLALDTINSESANKVNQQNANTAQASQQATAANQAGQLQLAKDSLAQAGTQFGLSLAQQKDLATLADKTQNRQIDVSSAQGQASLALELARIMGAKDLNSIDPTFLASIAKALGYAAPGGGGAGGPAGGGSNGGTPGGSGTGGAGGTTEGGTGDSRAAYYQPDPTKPGYNLDTSLPWGPS